MSLTPSPSLAADHLGAEEVAERLRRQQPLAGEEGREVERRRPVDARRKLHDAKGEALLRDARHARTSPCPARRCLPSGVQEFDVAADRNPLLGGRKRRIDDEQESGVAVEAAAAQARPAPPSTSSVIVLPGSR